MGAGILPIAFRKGKIYFLFGREYINATENNKVWKDAGKWSDFGGSKEQNETFAETAIREGYEELSGILGNKSKVRGLVYNAIKEINTKKYKTYICLVNYDSSLPEKFRNNFLKIKKHKPHLLCKNGLYEKDMIKWFSYEEIKKNSNIFRSWYYKQLITKILKQF
tara:strand:+ start:267 stop:761 length:495 start_codon:yes stop_codon:yes gene_type:complete